MSGNHSNDALQLEGGSRGDDPRQHRERHRDHKRRKERRDRGKSSKRSRSSSGKRRRDKSKRRHRHGSKERHGSKDRHSSSDRHERRHKSHDKAKYQVKYELDDGVHHQHHPASKVQKEREASVENHGRSSRGRKDRHRERSRDGRETTVLGGSEPRSERDHRDGHHLGKRKRGDSEEAVPVAPVAPVVVKKKRKKATKEPDASWWQEKRYDDGTKWRFLEHKGPLFYPEYQPLPDDVRLYYDGEPVKLSPPAEEVATFFAKMLHHDCIKKDVFRENFMKDWRQEMTEAERAKIDDLDKCDFREIRHHFKATARRPGSREERQKVEDENERLVQEYGFCTMDGRRERVTNFRTEPPGLFRGIKEDHPKMGLLKRRVRPEECVINCSQDSEWPKPPPGTEWKEVVHRNHVSWLAAWMDSLTHNMKYISTKDLDKVKGKVEKDWEKFEAARKLKRCVAQIRAQYRGDWQSDQMAVRQRAVALYFIDELALRVGNESEEGEAASDTVGCCSLRVEHITLHSEKDGKKYVVEFNFPGEDGGAARYYNVVQVEKRVFKNLRRFTEKKQPWNSVFNCLTAASLNQHLQELMPGLTARVFRTHNASVALQQQLRVLTHARDDVPDKILSYNRANRAVAAACHHQRAPPKTFEASTQNLLARIEAKKEELEAARREERRAEADAKDQKTDKAKRFAESKRKAVLSLEGQLERLVAYADDRDRQIAPGGSKLNYLDPRISMAWCKRYNVPIEKVYNRSQLDKFACYIDLANEDFEF